MKKIGLFLMVLLAGSVSAQQSENRNVGSFSALKAAEGIDVIIKKGDKEAVRVEATGVKLSDVLTEVSGNYLKIHMKDGNYRNTDVKVYVTYTSLNTIAASSAASVTTEGVLKANSLELSASSAGTLDLLIEANETEASASSAGDVELKGKSAKVSFDASSAGDIDAYDLQAEEGEAEASSAGEIKLSVTKKLDASASSGGSIRYRGSPEYSNTNASSGGSVKKAN